MTPKLNRLFDILATASDQVIAQLRSEAGPGGETEAQREMWAIDKAIADLREALEQGEYD